MDLLGSLATFGVVDVAIATTLGITTHQYLDAITKYLFFPMISNFINLDKLKYGGIFIGKFIKETIIYTFSLVAAYYLLSQYVPVFEKDINRYAQGSQVAGSKRV